MVALVQTVAYLGLEARSVEVQCQIAPGLPRFNVVGLPDKAVNESKERVQAALSAMGLSLPPKRITINLSPADLPKEGSHYDLPIALALLAAMGVTDAEQLGDYVAVGELALDGRIVASPGVLLAALHASAQDCSLICPAVQGSEAAWASGVAVVPAPNLISLLNHLKGTQQLPQPRPGEAEEPGFGPDLKQVKGQETAKRALEIAAAGGHNLLMIGPPGAGKSLLASCLPGILPPLTPAEALEVSMVASVAGTLEEGRISRSRPFRSPHQSASMAALTGGGLRVRPGEVSLAHLGVLFLDELPEFQRAVLDSLRQPLETGVVDVARANAHVTFPARVQLIAAMNPCARVAKPSSIEEEGGVEPVGGLPSGSGRLPPLGLKYRSISTSPSKIVMRSTMASTIWRFSSDERDGQRLCRSWASRMISSRERRPILRAVSSASARGNSSSSCCSLICSGSLRRVKPAMSSPPA